MNSFPALIVLFIYLNSILAVTSNDTGVRVPDCRKKVTVFGL